MSGAQQLTTRDRVTQWLLNRLSVSRWRRESQAARFDKQFWTCENGQLFFIPAKSSRRWGAGGKAALFSWKTERLFQGSRPLGSP